MHYGHSPPLPGSLLNRLALFGFVGAAIGGVCFVGYGLLFELVVLPTLVRPGQATLSYGQQAMVMTQFAAALGAAAGVSVPLVQRSFWVSAGSVDAAVAAGVALVAGGLWSFDFARYGNDPAYLILYLPLLAGSTILLTVGLLLLFVGTIRTLRERSHAVLPKQN